MKAIAAVTALIGLIAGFAIGFAYEKSVATAAAKADVDEMRFVRSLGTVSSSTNTLLFLEQRRGDKVQAFSEDLLRKYARDARESAPAARHAAAHLAQVDESLGQAAAYAQRHGMKDTVTDLMAIRQTLHGMAAAQ